MDEQAAQAAKDAQQKTDDDAARAAQQKADEERATNAKEAEAAKEKASKARTPAEKRAVAADALAALKTRAQAGEPVTVEQLDRLGDAYEAAINA